MAPAQHGGPRIGDPWPLEIGKLRNLHFELFNVRTKFNVYYLYTCHKTDRSTDRRTDRHIGLEQTLCKQERQANSLSVALLPHVAKCLLFHGTVAVSVAVCAVRCSEHGAGTWLGIISEVVSVERTVPVDVITGKRVASCRSKMDIHPVIYSFWKYATNSLTIAMCDMEHRTCATTN